MSRSYQVVVEKKAEKELNGLPPDIVDRILTALRGLSQNPRPYGYKKLIGLDGYRVRIGNYRILYTIDDSPPVVRIYRIAHRRDVYR